MPRCADLRSRQTKDVPIPDTRKFLPYHGQPFRNLVREGLFDDTPGMYRQLYCYE